MADKIAEIRKALIAAAVPGLTLLINDVTAELQTQVVALVAVVASGLLTFAVPNKES